FIASIRGRSPAQHSREEHKHTKHKNLSRNIIRLRQCSQRSRAVSDAIALDSKVAQERQMQICQWRFLWITNMPAAFDCSGASSRNNQRNVAGVVSVTLAHSRSVEQRRMIEQGTVTVRG